MIGLFLGNTDFPKLIIRNLKKKKIKYFIIDLTNKNRFIKDNNSYHINIGQFGKILNLIHTKKCKKVLFAGKINKPKFLSLRMDVKGFYYLPKIIKEFNSIDNKLKDKYTIFKMFALSMLLFLTIRYSSNFSPQLSILINV